MQHMNNLKRCVLMCKNPIVYQKVSRVHELNYIYTFILTYNTYLR